MQTSTEVYRERLVPGTLGWSAVVTFGLALGIALWPVNHAVAAVVGGLTTAAGLAAAWWLSPVVVVDSSGLRAGKASIEHHYLGAVRALDAAQMRDELGGRLDARAHVCLRAWARTGVLVELTDPHDPTPYWLVSSRRPEKLAEALTVARTSASAAE